MGGHSLGEEFLSQLQQSHASSRTFKDCFKNGSSMTVVPRGISSNGTDSGELNIRESMSETMESFGHG